MTFVKIVTNIQQPIIVNNRFDWSVTLHKRSPSVLRAHAEKRKCFNEYWPHFVKNKFDNVLCGWNVMKIEICTLICTWCASHVWVVGGDRMRENMVGRW